MNIVIEKPSNYTAAASKALREYWAANPDRKTDYPFSREETALRGALVIAGQMDAVSMQTWIQQMLQEQTNRNMKMESESQRRQAEWEARIDLMFQKLMTDIELNSKQPLLP